MGAANGAFNGWVCALSLLTAIFLQILSNLANDYGDFMHGADNADRQGPQRAVQTGLISPAAMKAAILVLALLSLVSGVILLWISASRIGWMSAGIMLALGIAAIIAAVTYTAGDKPYGYAGLGDISVFLFFGMLAVPGSIFLQKGSLSAVDFLPAAAYGLLSTAVLNVNNMRDIETDRIAGKHTIPVRIGRDAAKSYHFLLVGGACFALIVYSVLMAEHWVNWSYLPVFLLFGIHILGIMKTNRPAEFNPYLKQLALITFALSMVFGVCLLF